jgi:hypothetical protein
VKGSEHLRQITHFRDKRRFIRPFMDLMLMSARRGHIDRVVERLQNMENAVAVIGEDRAVNTRKWVQNILCGTAAKRLASKANYAALDAIEKLPECGHIEQYPTIPEYRAAALIRDNRYLKAYETVADLQREEISSLLIRACLPKEPDPEEKAKLLGYLEHKKKEGFIDQINTAAIFLAFEKPDLTLALLKELQPEMYKPQESKQIEHRRAWLRDGILKELFEKYYLEGQEEKAYEVIDLMKLFDYKYGANIKQNRRDLHQWWISMAPGVGIIADKPSPLGMAIALKFRDDKTRFAVLKGIFLRLDKYPDLMLPGCDDKAQSCILDEMEKIAVKESDELDRNIMYRLMANMAELSGDGKRQNEFKSRMTGGPSTTCVYDVCTGEESMHLKYASERSAGPGLFDYMMRGHDDDLQVTASADPVLADKVKRLIRVMNETRPDYRAVSAQSGYAVQYVNNLGSGRNGYRCPVDFR